MLEAALPESREILKPGMPALPSAFKTSVAPDDDGEDDAAPVRFGARPMFGATKARHKRPGYVRTSVVNRDVDIELVLSAGGFSDEEVVGAVNGVPNGWEAVGVAANVNQKGKMKWANDLCAAVGREACRMARTLSASNRASAKMDPITVWLFHRDPLIADREDVESELVPIRPLVGHNTPAVRTAHAEVKQRLRAMVEAAFEQAAGQYSQVLL